MKIFLKNINTNVKNINMNNTENRIKKVKLLPSYTKEWNNFAYFYNKNTLKTISSDYLTISAIIKNYFNLFIKNLTLKNLFFSLHKRRIRKLFNRKRKFLNKIWVSRPEIKYKNNVAKITLFIINRHKQITKRKYFFLNRLLLQKSIKKLYINLYKNQILKRFYFIINKSMYNNTYFSTILTKEKYLKSRFSNLFIFFTIKNLYVEKLIKNIILSLSKKYLKRIQRYENLHNLNQYKLDQSILLPKLSNILNNVIGKKIEYNIINLKSFIYHPDIFTEVLAQLITRRRRLTLPRNMSKVLKKVRLPKVTKINSNNIFKLTKNEWLKKYNDPKLISNVNNNSGFDHIINNYNEKKVYNTIFDSIHYKQLGGIRIEVKGRLTKRYRADRAISKFRSKGRIKNLYTSYKGVNATLFRGNTNSSSSFSLSKSKRRIGSFAVKGWIGGK